MPRLTTHARRELVEARQNQILQAAARVFADKGYDRATIHDVAQAAGVADGSIYRYFKNKKDILVHLPRQFIEPPIEAFQAANLHADSPPISPDALLQFIAENIAQIVIQNKELVRVLMSSLPTMDDATRATYIREGPGMALGPLEAYITAQQASGVFRADVDPALAARILPGMMMFFLVVQEIIQPNDMPRFEYDKIIPTIVTVYLNGLMK
jgi:AcrR family transcriptional regulator